VNPRYLHGRINFVIGIDLTDLKILMLKGHKNDLLAGKAQNTHARCPKYSNCSGSDPSHPEYNFQSAGFID
jgi:hypothetical protein